MFGINFRPATDGLSVKRNIPFVRRANESRMRFSTLFWVGPWMSLELVVLQSLSHITTVCWWPVLFFLPCGCKFYVSVFALVRPKALFAGSLYTYIAYCDFSCLLWRIGRLCLYVGVADVCLPPGRRGRRKKLKCLRVSASRIWSKVVVDAGCNARKGIADDRPTLKENSFINVAWKRPVTPTVTESVVRTRK